MPVTVILRKEQHEIPTPTTVGEVFRLLGLPPEQYLVIYQGELAGVDQPLSDGDTIRLVGVITGGESIS
jgi:sulfur carrier protein ThiS